MLTTAGAAFSTATTTGVLRSEAGAPSAGEAAAETGKNRRTKTERKRVDVGRSFGIIFLKYFMASFRFMSVRQRKTLEAIVEIVTEPARGRGSAELAKSLGMSRESVYQLLLPLVRAGLLIGDRGRNGGYRGAPGAASARLSEVLGLPRSLEPSADCPEWLRRIERVAGDAVLDVLDSTTVGELAGELSAARSAPTWEI
jgi:DNA-binding IscR family transcriptional regulator